ncbi:MAG: DUF1254 domain-containing protein [Sphingobacteriales bacterium]
MKLTLNSIILLLTLTLAACNGNNNTKEGEETKAAADKALTAAEARAIAKEAYIYGYPVVDDYRIQHAYFVQKDNTEYKGAYNVLHSAARVYTPADKAVQTPNSDTPYGMLGLDLRTEPFVLTIPKIEKGRYFSVQLVDAYTHNFNYLGSRTTGNDGGNYLVTGPNWKGEKPKGITEIIPCETELALVIYRTQLFNPQDLPNVVNIQKGYKVQPLSAFLGQPAPAQAPAISYVNPVNAAQTKNSLEFFNVLNFKLQFCPTHPSEVELRDRFKKIGIEAGKTFDSTKFSPEIREAIIQGRNDAWAAFAGLKAKMDKKEVSSGEMFGTRDFLKNNYLYRMGAAIVGIYGNSRNEAMYPVYMVDDQGKPLSGANSYVVEFPAGALPPVNAFWSLTMYEMPASLLVENPINRYLINSPMLPKLKKNKDGSITLYISHQSPGKDKEANWLPAPAGSFITVMRLYWPKDEAIEGKWTAPPMKKVG